jgi:hypothetical protein
MRGDNITESIIGSLKEVGGHTYDMVYDLIFTSERVIVVSIRHPGDVQTSVSWQSFIFGTWIGRRGEQLEQDKLSEERRSQSQRLTPGELLSQNPRNFEICYDILNSIEVTRRLFQWQMNFVVSRPEIVRRTRFSLNQIQVPEARRLAELVLSARLK